MTFKLIDLFCGCGGLSLGAHLAGFSTAFAADIDGNLRSAYRRNFGAGVAGQLDIAAARTVTLARKINGSEVVGVIGGPPCQGFSVMGRNAEDDPRNTLVAKFLELAVALRPAFFVMENVPGLMAERHLATREAALEAITSPYEFIGPIKLNAAEFGAATNRERVVVIGFDPNRMDPITEADLTSAKTDGPRTTVRDAIGDLPSPGEQIQAGGFGWTKMGDEAASAYARRMRTATPPEHLPKYARDMFERGFVTGFAPTRHTPDTAERFAATAPGKQETISRYHRLDWNKVAPTLRAGTGSDRGSYQAARPIHPEEPRVITVREAARLQGFPDWFLFHPTKWHSHRMIGNSVSPIFAEAIFKVIRAKLEGRSTLSSAA